MRFFCLTCRSVVLAGLILVSGWASGQVSQSPYSYFGLGTLQAQTEAGNFALGGITSVWANRYEVNSSNPASYSSLALPTFQVSMKANFLSLESESQSQELRGSAVNSIQLGLPMGKGWGAAFGIKPYSATGYSITSETALEDLTVRTTYDSEGGINRAFVGLSKSFSFQKGTHIWEDKGRLDSLKYYKNTISAGANLNILFGNITKTNRLSLGNSNYLATRVTEEGSYKGTAPQLGLTYRRNISIGFEDGLLRHRTDLIVGFNLDTPLDVSNESTSITESIILAQGQELVVDVANTASFSGIQTVPQNLTLGVALDRTTVGSRRWIIAGEYSMQDWTQFGVADDPNGVASFGQLERMSLGIQYMPISNPAKAQNAWQLAKYRVGVRQSSGNLVLDGIQIEDNAVTAGLAVPLIASGTASHFNFGMEFGQRGTVSERLVEENYLNFIIGFSFTPSPRSKWFAQRKYN